MACCGRRSATETSDSAIGSPAGEFPAIAVRYLGATTVTVRGPMTGRRYVFSLGAAAQPVDARDAPAILRSSLFRPL